MRLLVPRAPSGAAPPLAWGWHSRSSGDAKIRPAHVIAGSRRGAPARERCAAGTRRVPAAARVATADCLAQALVDQRNDTDARGASGRLPQGGGADRFVRGNRRVRAEPHDRAMDDQRLGALLRAIRIRRRLRQADVAAGTGVERSWVSRIERGHLRDVSTGRLRAIAGVLEVGLEIVPSWRGGEVSRVVNERHSRLHELFAAHLARTPGWEFATEVSFSFWGERGVIDILAWHATRGVLLVIELKTEIPDPAGLIAQVGRYRRLAPGIGRERGWDPTSVAT